MSTTSISLVEAVALLEVMGYKASKWQQERVTKKINQIDIAPGLSQVPDGSDESATLERCLKALADGNTIALVETDTAPAATPAKAEPKAAQRARIKENMNKEKARIKKAKADAAAGLGEVDGEMDLRDDDPEPEAEKQPAKPKGRAKKAAAPKAAAKPKGRAKKAAAPEPAAEPQPAKPKGKPAAAPKPQAPAKAAEGSEFRPRRIRVAKTRQYWCGVVIARHGLAAGITEAMVAEVDQLYGKPNPKETQAAMGFAWHACHGYSEAPKEE